MVFESIEPGQGKKFDELVQNMYGFVKFHHPSCGHCKKMSQAWKSLESELGDNETVNIIEVHAGSLPEIKSECAMRVNGYPTIMEVLPGGFAGKQHMGARDLPTLRDFFTETFKPLMKYDSNVILDTGKKDYPKYSNQSLLDDSAGVITHLVSKNKKKRGKPYTKKVHASSHQKKRGKPYTKKVCASSHQKKPIKAKKRKKTTRPRSRSESKRRGCNMRRHVWRP